MSLNDPTQICPTIPSIRTLHFMGHAPPIQCMIGSLAAHQRENVESPVSCPPSKPFSKLTLLQYSLLNLPLFCISNTTYMCLLQPRPLKLLTYLKLLNNVTLYHHHIFLLFLYSIIYCCMFWNLIISLPCVK